MPDLWMDVDTAVIVPANILPLIDDTDFKTIETAVVYNSAGIAITWNFVTTAGVVSGVAVTPTTGGVYDWSEPLADKGMYAMEIPASGGASANNDTEGFGWITGVATGVLPWRGPIIGFRAAALNNSLIDGSTIDVNVTAMAANVLTATAINAAAFTAAKFAEGAITATVIATDAMGSAELAASAVNKIADQVWNEILSDHLILNSTGGVMASIYYSTHVEDGVVVADAGNSTTQFKTDLSEDTDDHYNGGIVVIGSGTEYGQVRTIIDYDGTNKIIYISPALTGVPAADDAFTIAVARGAVEPTSWANLLLDITAGGNAGIDFDNIVGTLNAAELNADMDTYQSKTRMTDDNTGTTDRYTTIWFKNGEPVESGITSPTIQVYKRTDGTDLIGASAMTEIGAKGTYKYDATGAERSADGAGYIARCQATIGGATRTWLEVISRDS